MQIGNRNFDLENQAYIMGILNVTPDSFSDGGKFTHIEDAMKQVDIMINEGVDIIDIGGESTRPGHQIVGDQEEIDRVVPVIKAIKEKYDIPISIDTSKASVAEAALKAGADMINDVWGFKNQPKIAEVAAAYKVPVCLMHNRDNKDYNNLIDDMISDLNESIEIALNAGVDKSQIILDPGVGFAKTLDDNLEVMKSLERFKTMGYPILLGTSRKSMIGMALDLPVDQRLEGTIATTVLGYVKGCTIFRVHDVRANLRALRMTEKMLNAGGR